MSPEPVTTASSVTLTRRRFRAFGGARCELLAEASSSASELDAVITDVAAFEARLSRFGSDSELSAFNRDSGWVAVSPLLHRLLSLALEAERISGGSVNCGCERAMCRGGYDASIEVVRTRSADHRVVAEPAGPLAPLASVLELAPGRARHAPGTGIDLGAIAKGWLADCLAMRFDRALVNLGGDLRAVGGEQQPWAVTLCDGREVQLTDGGVATSGRGQRLIASGHHVLDPRSGAAIESAHVAVSVVARSAFDAEVLSTVALLDGLTATRVAGAIDIASVRA